MTAFWFCCSADRFAVKNQDNITAHPKSFRYRRFINFCYSVHSGNSENPRNLGISTLIGIFPADTAYSRFPCPAQLLTALFRKTGRRGRKTIDRSRWHVGVCVRPLPPTTTTTTTTPTTSEYHNRFRVPAATAFVRITRVRPPLHVYY